MNMWIVNVNADHARTTSDEHFHFFSAMSNGVVFSLQKLKIKFDGMTCDKLYADQLINGYPDPNRLTVVNGLSRRAQFFVPLASRRERCALLRSNFDEYGVTSVNQIQNIPTRLRTLVSCFQTVVTQHLLPDHHICKLTYNRPRRSSS